MADVRYYVKSGRRVRGPFTMDQLVSMRDRGRLALKAEVSTDRANWFPAEYVEGLFANTVPDSPNAIWFYNSGGEHIGPLTMEQLRDEASQEMLLPSDTVWSEGMPKWVPAHAIRELRPAFGTDSIHAARKFTAGWLAKTELSILLAGAFVLVTGLIAAWTMLTRTQASIDPEVPQTPALGTGNISTTMQCPDCLGQVVMCGRCAGVGVLARTCGDCVGGRIDCNFTQTESAFLNDTTLECRDGELFRDGVSTGQKCDICNGTAQRVCATCEGLGELQTKCQACDGSGENGGCKRCGGSGIIRR